MPGFSISTLFIKAIETREKPEASQGGWQVLFVGNCQIVAFKIRTYRSPIPFAKFLYPLIGGIWHARNGHTTPNKRLMHPQTLFAAWVKLQERRSARRHLSPGFATSHDFTVTSVSFLNGQLAWFFFLSFCRSVISSIITCDLFQRDHSTKTRMIRQFLSLRFHGLTSQCPFAISADHKYRVTISAPWAARLARSGSLRREILFWC